MSNEIFSMARSDIKSDIGMFDISCIGDETIDRAKRVLAGFSHGADKAIGSALKRAAASGEAYAARAVQGEYYISSSDFKRYTKSKRHFVSDSSGTTVTIFFRGVHIPLLKFNTRIGKDGRIETRVKKTSAKTTLDHVFVQTVGANGHTGVFERLTDRRLPIEEKLGPSTPQMMNSNEEVSEAIADKVRETFDGRIEHEISAILNGWRK